MGMIYLNKKGFIEKSLYGNSEVDFNDSFLPKTRKEQFKYIFKNNWLKLFYLNLVIFLFFIPAIIYYFVSNLNYSNLISTMTDTEVYSQLFSLNLMRYLILSLLFMLGFIGLAGGLYVIRKMIFDDVVSLRKDFLKGIKNSAKQFSLLGFLFGITLFAFDYSEQYVMLSKMAPLLQIIMVFMILFIFILLVIGIMYMLNLSNLYVMNMFSIIKSGLLLTFRNLFKNLGVSLLAFGPVFVWILLPGVTLKIISVFILSVIGFSYIMLLFSLLAMYSFDKYINPVQYPDFVRRGLSKDE